MKKGPVIERPLGFVNKKRHNNWCMPLFPSQIKYQPTEWEKLLTALNLTEEDRLALSNSVRVRAFVRQNKNQRYIPEWVLEIFGEPVYIDWE